MKQWGLKRGHNQRIDIYESTLIKVNEWTEDPPISLAKANKKEIENHH